MSELETTDVRVIMVHGRPEYSGPPWKQLSPAIRTRRVIECLDLGFGYEDIARILKAFGASGEYSRHVISGHIHNHKLRHHQKRKRPSRSGQWSLRDQQSWKPRAVEVKTTPMQVTVVEEGVPVTAATLSPTLIGSVRRCQPIGFCCETVQIRVPGGRSVSESCGEFTGSKKLNVCPAHAALRKQNRA